MTEEENSDPVQTQSQESAAAGPPPQLALNDLSSAIQIIDVAASRGAFRGEELSQVGGVRDRLSLFLNANLPPQENNEEEEPAAEEEE
ncbi:MAG: hypothetical protein P1V20_18620 [Verrucomicrobiales bacterium]|nr:hypothetical protein [Verrucomicrobiales bacterium]